MAASCTSMSAGTAALELQHSEPQLLERINSYFGYPAVARLRLIQAPPALPRHAPAAPAARPSMRTERAEIEAVVQPVADDALRAALAGLGATLKAQPESSSTEREARVMARASGSVSTAAVGAAAAAPAGSPPGRLRARGGKPTRIQRMLLEPARDAEQRGDDVAAFRDYLQRRAKTAWSTRSSRSPASTSRAAAPRRTTPRRRAGIRRPRIAAIAQAQRNLARMYENGRGVPQDDAKALALYREAAARGDASAAVQGRPVRGGTAAAPRPIPWRRWSTIAPRRRLARSTRSWRWPGCSAPTTAVPEDPARSAKWYARSASRSSRSRRAPGDAAAREQLAELYLDGRGVPKNVGRALALLRGGGARRPHRRPGQARAAAAQGRGRRGCRPGEGRRAISRWRPTRATAAQAMPWRRCMPTARACRRTARGRSRCTSRACEQGETRAYVRLGDLYAKGEAVPQDHVEAVRWYSLAAEHGDPKGLFRLGEAYERGRGVADRPGAGADVVQPGRAVGLRAGGRAGRAGRGQARAGAKPSAAAQLADGLAAGAAAERLPA